MKTMLLILCLFTVGCTADHSKCVSRESYDKQIDSMLEAMGQLSKEGHANSKAIDEVRQRTIAHMDAINGTFATHKSAIVTLQQFNAQIIHALTNQSKINAALTERTAAGR